MRAGENSDFAVIDTLQESELFYCNYSESSDWTKVKKCEGDSGYVHKSRIQLIKNMSKQEIHKLFKSVFAKESELFYYHLLNSSSQAKRIKMEKYSEQILNPLLKILPEYISTTKDTALFQDFLDIINLEKHSADELPSFVLGQIYIENPDFTLESVSLKYTPQLHEALKWGFDNIIFEKEKQINNYSTLKDKLANLKEFKFPPIIPQCADIAVNSLYLWDRNSVEEMLGSDIHWEYQDDDIFPRYCVSNRDQTQFLTLIFHPGSIKNEFSECIISYQPPEEQIHTLDFIEEFETLKNIQLGTKKDKLKNELGYPHNETSINDTTIVQYKIDNLKDSDFLKFYYTPIYYGNYTFAKDRLIQIQFGFEYP